MKKVWTLHTCRKVGRKSEACVWGQSWPLLIFLCMIKLGPWSEQS